MVSVYERATTGLSLTAMTSYVNWGLWISADIYFIGLSAGAFLVSSLVYVFQVKALERVGKLALFTALVMLVMAILSAWFDIGQIGRFYEIFTSPNFSSILNDIVWLYSAYFLLLLAELLLAVRPDLLARSQLQGINGKLSRLLLLGRTNPTPESLKWDRKFIRILASIGVPLAITFHGGMGVLFATLVARPYWYGPFYPIFFLAGALVSGAALLTALVTFLWPEKRDEGYKETVTYLGRIVVWLILFDLLLEFAELTVPSWYGVGTEVTLVQTVLFGEYWYVFWVFQLMLGMVVPLFLLVFLSRRPRIVGLAGALVGLNYFAVRLDIVIPGLITPQIPGLQTAYIDPRLIFEYFPSAFEWEVLLFVVTLGVGLFYLGYRFLPLTSMQRTLASVTSSRDTGVERVEPTNPRVGNVNRRDVVVKAIGVAAFGASVIVGKNALKAVASALTSGQEQAQKLERERFVVNARQILDDLSASEGVGSGSLVGQDKLIEAAGGRTSAVSSLLVPSASKIDSSSAGWSQSYVWLPGQPTIQVQSEPISGEEDPMGRMMQDLARALTKPANQHQWGMVFDARKCTGCYACTVACKAENKEPPGVEYRPVILQEHGDYPNLSMTFLPRPCMQCANPPCVPVCPVYATFMRPDGIVAIDYDVCIGCRYCVTSCPYQARTFDWGLFYTEGTPQVEPYETLPSFEYGSDTWERPVQGTDSPKFNTRKCHFCIHRLESGMLPACVTTCVGRSNYFGDLNDPESYVSQLLTQQGVSRLKEDLGTEPRVYYIGLTQATVDGRPVEG